MKQVEVKVEDLGAEEKTSAKVKVNPSQRYLKFLHVRHSGERRNPEDSDWIPCQARNDKRINIPLSDIVREKFSDLSV